MKLNISELMDDILDDADLEAIEMADPGVTTPDRIMALATGAALPAAPAAPAVKKRPRRLVRTLLIAAALVLALSATALAVYQYGMADRTIEVFPDIVEHTNIYGDQMENYSTVGYSDSPEYQALTEWHAWLNSITGPYNDTQLLDYDSPYRFYCGYQFMADKLDEIVEKYGLRLLDKSCYAYTMEDLCQILHIESFGNWAEDECYATIYDDGSFDAAHLHLQPADGGGEWWLILYRSVRGTFTDFFVDGAAADTYTFESYTAADGTAVELALGFNDCFLFAELENCFITVTLSGGYAPYNPAITALMDMEDLEQIADSISPLPPWTAWTAPPWPRTSPPCMRHR